jgi:hypothetical protein
MARPKLINTRRNPIKCPDLFSRDHPLVSKLPALGIPPSMLALRATVVGNTGAGAAR